MIEWRLRADAHETVRADIDHADSGIVVEMWNDLFRHETPILVCVKSWAGTIMARCRDFHQPVAKKGFVARYLREDGVVAECSRKDRPNLRAIWWLIRANRPQGRKWTGHARAKI